MLKTTDYRYGLYQLTTISHIGDWGRSLIDQFYLDCDEQDLKDNPEARRCWKVVQRKINTINRLVKKECEVLTP